MFVNATAWADDAKIAMSSFEINPGEAKQVTIDLVQGDIPVLGFQGEIVLPAGLTIQGKMKPVAGTLTDEYDDPADPIVNYNDGTFLVYNSEGLSFNSTAKEIVIFKVAAAEDFAGGTITIKNIVISAEGNKKITPADFTVAVTLPVQIEYPSLAMEDFEITGGEKKAVTLKLMQNGLKKVLGFQCELELPAGLTVGGKTKPVEGTLTDEYGDPATPIVNYNDGILLVYNSEGLTFNITAEDVVTFTFAAAEGFEAGTIKFKNIVISAEGNEKIEPKDFEVKFAPTGISEINANTTSEAYTLSGTRVRNNNLQRGLYIVNGKKVVVK
jgi:hypothetical protein